MLDPTNCANFLRLCNSLNLFLNFKITHNPYDYFPLRKRLEIPKNSGTININCNEF